jgi:large repetitive protein
MKYHINPISKKIRLLGLTLAVALLASASRAATPVTMSDLNSVAIVDVDSNAGMYQWTVGGVNQLAQQWFWYRIGNGTAVQPINSIGPAVWNQANGINSLSTTYNNAQLKVSIDYTLTGGTAGDADIVESISVKNNTASPLDLHFFQYSDFDLANNPLGDTITISGSPGSGFYLARQTKLLTQLSETVTAPNATRAEAAFQSQILNEFLIPGYNLNNNQGPVGPGDVTWGLQWDLTVAPGATFDIFKDKRLDVSPVPEPSVLALFGLGLAAMAVRRLRHLA